MSGDSDAVRASKIGRTGTIVGAIAGALVAGVFALVLTRVNANATQGGGSPPPPPPSSTTPTSPPTTPSSPTGTSSATSKPSQPDEDRRYFEALIDSSRLYVYMVWRGNGEVALSGAFELSSESDTCRLTVEAKPLNEDGLPVGKSEIRHCPTNIPKSDWPEFIIELPNDGKIADVRLEVKLDNELAATFICPRNADCKRIS